MTPPKVYISADTFMLDSWKLASMVRKSGWKPDVLLALWRGGAGVGIAVHEFFKVTGWGSVRHYPLKCASYSGICENSSDVVFTLGAEIPEHPLKLKDKAFLIPYICICHITPY